MKAGNYCFISEVPSIVLVFILTKKNTYQLWKAQLEVITAVIIFKKEKKTPPLHRAKVNHNLSPPAATFH